MARQAEVKGLSYLLTLGHGFRDQAKPRYSPRQLLELCWWLTNPPTLVLLFFWFILLQTNPRKSFPSLLTDLTRHPLGGVAPHWWNADAQSNTLTCLGSCSQAMRHEIVCECDLSFLTAKVVAVIFVFCCNFGKKWVILSCADIKLIQRHKLLKC